MKLKKILAAIAVCAMSATVLTMTVSAACGVADDATLDDAGDEEIADDDEGDDEIPVEDEGEDEDETPAPVVDETPAPNPPTGNSPIALAVIPVALAAAAVVGKKAK